MAHYVSRLQQSYRYLQFRLPQGFVRLFDSVDACSRGLACPRAAGTSVTLAECALQQSPYETNVLVSERLLLCSPGPKLLAT